MGKPKPRPERTAEQLRMAAEAAVGFLARTGRLPDCWARDRQLVGAMVSLGACAVTLRRMGAAVPLHLVEGAER